MALTNSRAKAIGSFLRSRRERLTPEQAGVSVTYYTWLEQGRDLIPSKDVIDSIAQALRLSPEEKKMWNPHAAETSLTAGTSVDPQIQKIIDQRAFPSHITNERTEVPAWNKAASD